MKHSLTSRLLGITLSLCASNTVLAQPVTTVITHGWTLDNERAPWITTMAEAVIAAKLPSVQKLDPDTYWWCGCGRSQSQPFCDGSHSGTEFLPMEMEFTEAAHVAICLCKRSARMPYCDGTHSRLGDG